MTTITQEKTAKLQGNKGNSERAIMIKNEALQIARDILSKEAGMIELYKLLGEKSETLKTQYEMSDSQIAEYFKSQGTEFHRVKINRARKVFVLKLVGEQAQSVINGRKMDESIKDPNKTTPKTTTPKKEKGADELEKLASELVKKYNHNQLTQLFAMVSKLDAIREQGDSGKAKTK